MPVFLEKFLPLLVYPLGLALILLALSLFLRQRSKAETFTIVLAIMILWLCSTRYVALSLVRSLEWRYLPMEQVPAADALVVLGGGTESPQYPRSMVEVNAAGDRVIYAAQLYKEGKASFILVSGGSNPSLDARTSSPAEDMSTILGMLGIPQDVIWVQPNSINTAEDALYSSRMLRDAGINRVILVTSAIHMPRSVDLFIAQGIEVIPAPVDYTVTQQVWDELWGGSWQEMIISGMPNASSLAQTTNSMKEYIGMFVNNIQNED
ncbi:MAG: YdcF family protein [Anaerolineaceae bacterium]|nr:YdcF family protein [Anaerolineaceae bacterium]